MMGVAATRTRTGEMITGIRTIAIDNQQQLVITDSSNNSKKNSNNNDDHEMTIRQTTATETIQIINKND